ncbi:tetratricopeptide repeat protein [Flavobacterium sp. I3-2]|uniref:tetratricopeptide repeat protein n=1 Tax=Flavobacterium sp. I3-2 TaxID=2748319 RepID=UPI0015AEE325|nr:tetratricopeptide repeat protein [Flavobacterium sp. I3-2]
MSLKNLYIIAISLFAVGCFAQNNPFEHLSLDERNQLADKYHKLSMEKYQTSEMHRIYKDSALMANPKNAEYTERYSYSYKKAGEHIKAMKLLNKAVAMDLENNKTNALEYKAWSMLYFYRDYEAAIKDVDLILEMKKEQPLIACHGEPCLLIKGQALYQLDKNQEAIETLEKLLELDKKRGFDPLDNFLAYFYIARSYTKIGNIDKAIEYYQNQLAVYDNFTEMHYQLGKIYLDKNEIDKADLHLKKAKQLIEKGTKMYEPYIERFDEVFVEEIDLELDRLKIKNEP